MKVMNGRFGLYVTDGVVNASLPRGMEASSLTTERAIELIDAREAKLRDDGKDPRAQKPEKGAKKPRASAKTKSEETVPPAPRTRKASGGKRASK